MKKIIRRLICLVGVLCLLFSSLTIYAETGEEKTKIKYELSELEYFSELRSYTDDELYEKGLSEEQVDYIRNFDLVGAIKERAQLSESVLKDLGYTDEEISTLKSIVKRKSLSEADILKEVKGATLTLTLNSPSTSKSRYTYNFSFRWSSCPIFIDSDLLGATWSATGSNGQSVNVAINKSLSSLTTKYKYTGGAPSMPDKSYKWNYVHEYRAAKLEFDMGYNLGNGMSYWTYYGSGKLVLDAVVSNTIYEVYLKFGYGHSVVTGNPSVSFSGSGPSIGMTFGLTTQNLKTYSVRYRYDGKKMS